MGTPWAIEAQFLLVNPLTDAQAEALADQVERMTHIPPHLTISQTGPDPVALVAETLKRVAHACDIAEIPASLHEFRVRPTQSEAEATAELARLTATSHD